MRSATRIASAGLSLLSCLLLLLISCAVGSAQSMPHVSPFDIYGRITWSEELKRLDLFANELKKQPETIGYIYIQEAQISGEGYAVGHAVDLTKYLFGLFRALPQKSISVVTSFGFSLCDFVDRSFCPLKLTTIHEVTRTTQTKYFRLELEVTFRAKPLINR